MLFLLMPFPFYMRKDLPLNPISNMCFLFKLRHFFNHLFPCYPNTIFLKFYLTSTGVRQSISVVLRIKHASELCSGFDKTDSGVQPEF